MMSLCGNIPYCQTRKFDVLHLGVIIKSTIAIFIDTVEIAHRRLNSQLTFNVFGLKKAAKIKQEACMVPLNARFGHKVTTLHSSI